MPGSLAEVVASPAGPKVGAFFDMDGTLVAGFTAAAFTEDRIRRRQMGIGEFVGMVQAALSHQLGRLEFEDLIDVGAAMMKGMSISDLDELGERLFAQKIVSRIYPEMRTLVRAHLDRGHTVVLSSSALTIQVEPVARFLGIETILSNRFETDDDGLLTGAVVRPILWGPEKAKGVQDFAAEHGVDLAKSYFYADGDEDVALMYLVGNPRPTNPAGKMAAVAAKRGWPVLKFSSRGGGALSQVRNIAGIASLLPVAAGALGVGLLTRDRRRGVNFLTSNWPALLLAANGVKLEVVGGENLTAARPAVFIFNHRNNFDAIITAALVRDNWTGVGKKELEENPIMGAIGKLMDTAFIDRDDSCAAVESLQKIAETGRKGLSIIIAPEGTRVDTTEVGPFKKGSFHIAMSAQIPIVPIVIRNAESIAAQHSSTMSPGTVDVAVLPPISIADWTLANLPDRIAEVRQLFVDTLKGWPDDASPGERGDTAAPPTGSATKPPDPRISSAKKAPARKTSATGLKGRS